MRDDRHCQHFTVFGGHISESHGERFHREPKSGSTGKVSALLAMLLIGFTTAAAATAKSRSHSRAEYSVPMQPASTFIMKLPGAVGFEEALY